jgi:integrase
VTSVLEPGLEERPDGVIIRDMLTIIDAIDLFLGDKARRGRTDRTRDSYRRTLDKFSDRYPRRWDVAQIKEDDCTAFLALWGNRKVGTQAQVYAPLNGLFGHLHHTRKIKTNPMEFVDPPTRQRPGDLDVVTVNVLDVPPMLAAAKPGTERNALHILAYLGPRRRAVAALRLPDYDQKAGTLRFQEKGRKTIRKPVPDELKEVLDASIKAGHIWDAPHDYLVPPEARSANAMVRKDGRNDRIIWNVVKRVAERVGIEAHVHAMRGAFACFYLLNNPGDLHGLQELLGHENPATTMVYLRKFDRQVAMEPVRSLSWGATLTEDFPANSGGMLSSSSVVGAGGFEPPFPEGRGGKRPRSQPQGGNA